jgi:hypothetical protein
MRKNATLNVRHVLLLQWVGYLAGISSFNPQEGGDAERRTSVRTTLVLQLSIHKRSLISGIFALHWGIAANIPATAGNSVLHSCQGIRRI